MFTHRYLGSSWLSVDLRCSLETGPRGWESEQENRRPLKGRQAALKEKLDAAGLRVCKRWEKPKG